MRRLLLSICLTSLCLSPARANIPSLEDAPDPCPGVDFFVSGGASLFGAATAAVKLRDACHYEAGVRGGVGPDSWTVEARTNWFLDNPDPVHHATWYMGPGLAYYDEDGETGAFQLGFVDIMLGREHRWTERWRFNYEWGLAVMLFEGFQGGGAPILFPVLPMARAEVSYRL